MKMKTSRQSNVWTSRDIALALMIIVGLGSIVGISRWMDRRRLPTDTNIEEENLYVTGRTARRVSLGFNGLLADWYWMRSLQYVGRKILSLPDEVPLDDLGSLKLKLLAPLLDTATTLDPQFMEPYEYAAVVLPAVNVDEAIRITRKGIAANPSTWRLYQHLGYIYWQRRDFKSASETYGAGARIPGAPAWMEAMRARMLAEGGSRTTAREIYLRMYEQAGDDKVRDMARRRLLQLDSLDEQDVIRKILSGYSGKAGHCPATWREIELFLRASRFRVDAAGAPLDSAGTPYRLVKNGCDVDLDPKSEVPYK
jgi:tetratricopeptide (TPR) repeat protein